MAKILEGRRPWRSAVLVCVRRNRGKEAPHEAPQSRTGDSDRTILSETIDEVCIGILARPRDRPTLHEVLIKCDAGQQRQRDHTAPTFLARQVQPVTAVRVDVEAAEGRANQLAGAHASRVGEVK